MRSDQRTRLEIVLPYYQVACLGPIFLGSRECWSSIGISKTFGKLSTSLTRSINPIQLDEIIRQNNYVHTKDSSHRTGFGILVSCRLTTYQAVTVKDNLARCTRGLQNGLPRNDEEWSYKGPTTCQFQIALGTSKPFWFFWDAFDAPLYVDFSRRRYEYLHQLIQIGFPILRLLRLVLLNEPDDVKNDDCS